MNTAICIICKTPTQVWCDFLSKFSNYDIYVVIDDNSRFYVSPYPNVKFIQYNEYDLLNEHFTRLCIVTIPKLVTAWDKAIYHFSKNNTNYKHVWFFEDDVFFHSENTVKTIDEDYPDSDLLVQGCNENLKGDRSYWHWGRMHIPIPPPYYSSMVCAVRLSNTLLIKIKEHVEKYKSYFFLEALFPTLCKSNNLLYDTPKSMKHVSFDYKFKSDEINQTNIFHPIKDLNLHNIYRNL
jgi:hypothetical protein